MGFFVQVLWFPLLFSVYGFSQLQKQNKKTCIPETVHCAVRGNKMVQKYRTPALRVFTIIIVLTDLQMGERRRGGGGWRKRRGLEVGVHNNRGFPTRMVYLDCITCLRYTILVRNPQYDLVHLQWYLQLHPQQQYRVGVMDWDCSLIFFFLSFMKNDTDRSLAKMNWGCLVIFPLATMQFSGKAADRLNYTYPIITD